MGCDITLPFGAPLADVRALFDARDARFSRFLPSSELNRVNATSLGLTLVSEEFASMLQHGLDAARATGGLVTPCVGGAILSAGYDRDFSLLPDDVGAVEPAPVPSVSSISLLGRGLLRTEPVTLDLNGVVKGRTVDDALALVGSGWISAGGDIAAVDTGRGRASRWRQRDAARRRTRDEQRGASPLARRRAAAEPPDRSAHGSARPRARGATSRSPRRRASHADVAAKAALLLGLEGPGWLDERSLAGRFVDHDGNVILNGAWRAGRRFR